MRKVMDKKDRPRCGAKCRSRNYAPCQALVVWDKKNDRPRNGRCRMHGGLSSGPKTEEGRKKISEAVKLRWKKYRDLRILKGHQ